MPSTPTTTTPPLPHTFKTLKRQILTSLSTPSTTYADASPRGSVDTALLPLINRLNGLEGIVTTSSCAGRVSVFVEGSKVKGRRSRDDGIDGDLEDKGEDVVKGEEGQRKGKRKGGSKAVPGGKGLGGRWAYVSHEPIAASKGDGGGGGLRGMFGLRPKGGEGVCRYTNDARFVRFAFEPMILHIATASLAHASPVLSAAISAGFRESGVQSLRNLNDPNALPMVAIRSAGLALESIIGVVRDMRDRANPSEDGEDDNNIDEIAEALVDEGYLEMLVQIANERFEANMERIRRFEENLFGGNGKKDEDEWEDKVKRQERKRREGLMKKEALKAGSDGYVFNEG